MGRFGANRDPRLVFIAMVAFMAAIGVVILLIARGSGDSEADGGSLKVLSEGCGSAEPSAERRVDAPPSDFAVQAGTTTVVSTSQGSFTIALDIDRAPVTSASFAYLVGKRFFDGLTFHKIVPGFVIQGGDPLGDGTGGPGYCVNEPPPADVIYSRGTVAMAKSSAEPRGHSGSQFFVVTRADAGLAPDFALLGQVTKGMDVVERIEAVELASGTERPQEPVVIEKIRLQP